MPSAADFPLASRLNLPCMTTQVLETRKAEGLKMPRVLYTIPVAQNPTGCITTEERKKGVYQICQEFDIILIEDDPYYYLQYGGVSTWGSVSDSQRDRQGKEGEFSRRMALVCPDMLPRCQHVPAAKGCSRGASASKEPSQRKLPPAFGAGDQAASG